MRKVKCCCCQEVLPINEAYRVEKRTKTGKIKRFYFCSQEEYEETERKTRQFLADKLIINNTINEIIGYENKNTVMFGEEIKWCKTPYAVDAIVGHMDYIRQAVAGKIFNSEYCLIRYLSTVINNNLENWIEQVKVDNAINEWLENKETVVDDDVKLIRRTSKKRHCLKDYDED